MQILLACAKTMNSIIGRQYHFTATRPLFEKEANRLAADTCQLSLKELENHLQCSAKIAKENFYRYQNFFEDTERLPAIFAYKGQVFRMIKAEELSLASLLYAQNHLWISSFLYGLLRPLDLIHPYRMDGKVILPTTKGEDLFHFWRSRLTQVLIQSVLQDDGILLHLATSEMEHLFEWKKVRQAVRIIKPDFLIDNGVQQKVSSFYAKTGRGAMTRFILEQQVSTVSTIRDFQYSGFSLSYTQSSSNQPIFVRKID